MPRYERGDRGSIPCGHTKLWGLSSIGRALALQAKCCRFEAGRLQELREYGGMVNAVDLRSAESNLLGVQVPLLARFQGEMSERFMVHAWKACVRHCTLSSNLSLSVSFSLSVVILVLGYCSIYKLGKGLICQCLGVIIESILKNTTLKEEMR